MQFRQALANIFAAKLRAFLAILGILVGTASVVALVSSGQLATDKALEQFKALGTDLFAISFFEKKISREATPANTLTLEEVEELNDSIAVIKAAAPYTNLYTEVNYEGQRLRGGIIGATEDLQQAIKIKVQQGRFISHLDTFDYHCVIGHDIYKKLKKFNQDNLIGSQIRFGKMIFTIVGILEPWDENSFFNQDINRSVIVPLKTSQLISKSVKIRNIVLRVAENTNIEALKTEVNAFMQTAAPELNVFFRSAKQLVASMRKQSQIFTLLLGLIGGISLLVGGIGVMNVMLVSVTERRREIGIRMAIGAKRKDIQMQFLFESVTLALFGGILGIIVGIVAAFIIASIAHWGFHFFILPPLLGFIVSAAVGVFFGFYPAHLAAQLDPITTLRYE